MIKGPVLKRAAVRMSTRSRSRAAVKCLQLLQFLVIVEADRMRSPGLPNNNILEWRELLTTHSKLLHQSRSATFSAIGLLTTSTQP